MGQGSSRRASADPEDSRPARGQWYFWYVLALSVLLVASVVAEAGGLRSVVLTASAGFWVLAALAILADTPIVRIAQPGFPPPVLTSVTFCYAISYGWDNGTARVTQAVAILVVSGVAGRGLRPTTFDVARYGLALAAASETATAIGRPTPFGPGSAALLALLVAAGAWYVTFRLLTAVESWLYMGGGWAQALLRGLPSEAISAAALLLLSPMLLLVAQAGAWLIPLVVAPIFAVSQMTQLYARLQQRATHDPLTGLPNRLALSAAVEAPIQRCADREADGSSAALLIADVAQLGRVNQALGHRVGDAVVVATARRLSDAAGPGAVVARLQSDEFAIFLWGLADGEAFARAAALRARFDEPTIVDGQPLSMSVVLGVALCPQHGTTVDTLERRAAIAMERAKDLPQRVAVFQPDRDAPVADEISLLSDLHRALEEPDGQIVPFYQPQVEIATGEVVGVEALLRWRHPARGMISPDHVVRVAEYSPLMQKISTTMLEQVLTQLAAWRAQGWVVNTSTNVSVLDLRSDDLVIWLETRLRQHDIAPSQLTLELTESALLSQFPTVLDRMRHLRHIGVGASLDDFGTGFSSLQHLRRLPLTEIKIDRSFVQSMMESPRDAAIVRTVIGLGRELGLTVVAEGVETDQMRTRLLAYGCPVAQGWYYAAPMPADDFALWCSRRPACGRQRPA